MPKVYKPFVKTLNFDAYRDDEPIIVNMKSNHGIKTASENDSPVLLWDAKNPVSPNHERLLTTALGAFEGYGANVNGDGFHEDHLCSVPEGVHYPHGPRNKAYDKPIFNTFVDFSGLYRQHRNKPHDKAYGDIRYAHYNKRMRRVELILDFYVDEPENFEMLNDMEKGIYPDVSMGFRCVPGDVCPICQNYARPFPTRGHYCNHLKQNMLGIDPETGKLIYAINHNGYFFDLSTVRRGADRIAKGSKRLKRPPKTVSSKMAKVASINEAMPEFTEYSSKLAEEDGSAAAIETFEAEKAKPEKKASLLPPAIEAIKDDPDPDFRVLGVPLVQRTDLPIDKEALDFIAKRYNPTDIMATMTGVGIMPTPQEFQRIVLVGAGQDKYAEWLDDNNYVFDHTMDIPPDDSLSIDKGEFNPKLAQDLREAGIIDQRSYLSPFLIKRASMIKEAIGAEEFFDRYPIIKNPIPIKKLPENYASQVAAQGLNSSVIGQYYQRYPNPVMNDNRYVSAKPDGATVKRNANPLIPFAVLAALYGGTRWLGGLSQRGPVGKFVAGNPINAASVFGGTAALSWLIGRAGISPPPAKTAAINRQKAYFTAYDLGKDYMLHLLSGLAIGYGVASRAERKREFGIQPNVIEGAYEKRPAIASLLTATGIGSTLHYVPKVMRKFASEELSNLEDSILVNDHVIGMYSPEYLDKMARKSLCISALKLKK